MIGFEHITRMSRTSPSKIVLLIIDGLGGLPHPETGKTELESARKPNLNRIAKDSICGLIDPVSPGITPGSAPGHLAIFGSDPVRYHIGRGVMEALGIDVELKPDDIAARGNFCTVDDKGIITHRRAGRISTDRNTVLCRLLSNITTAGAEISVLPVKEHRFVLILRGEALSAELGDSDPPWPGAGERVLDDDGKDLPPGEVGTVYMKLMMDFAYKGDPEKTKASRRGEWFTVGDVGWLDADGYLFLCNRKIDMIISGGANIYPAEVESALEEHPAVASAIVVGLPCEELGARVHAIIQPRPGHVLDPRDVHAFLGTRLARYKLPESYELVGEPLRDDAGKARRTVLRAERVRWSEEGRNFKIKAAGF